MGSSELEGYLPLSETKGGGGGKKIGSRAFAGSVAVGIGLIWVYRASYVPKQGEEGRWAWMGLFAAELWFGSYWLLTQASRWNPIYRRTFRDRLTTRFEDELPGVDIFVCTADPKIEPPAMVISTVLSVMAYDYPPEKLSVYLSDDGGSDVTLYALLEASRFSKHWIPYSKMFHVEPRSPAAYFASNPPPGDSIQAPRFAAIKKLYEEMAGRIEVAAKLGRVPEEVRSQHRQFSQWDSFSSKNDHDTILQIVIDGREAGAVDIEGCLLPTLVYLAREKRPHQFHNFKAGAMNALIRVSEKISNGAIILNVDCDMYSNSSQSVRDALCFFMDERQGHGVAYVQFPQSFENVTKNELYGETMRIIREVDFHGLDGAGGPMYIGTGCFHRRASLCGMKFSEKRRDCWETRNDRSGDETPRQLEEKLKVLASCSYEKNTQWGKKLGVKYGCPVEDVITGLFIQCQGWGSVYFNPQRKAFLGVAPTRLDQTLMQHKRWSEGDLHILLSEYSPILYGHGRISTALRMGYCVYCFWAPTSFPILYYSVVPSLFLLRGIPLFPQISSPWMLPFMYIILSKIVSTFLEFIWAGGTALGWWNDQRMWLYKRTSSFLCACIDTALKLTGVSDMSFDISEKVASKEVAQRYQQEIMEFGVAYPMFTILSTVALLNLFCLAGAVKEVVMSDGGMGVIGTLAVQVLLCGLLVLINLPLYQGLFLRQDTGKIPVSITVKSVGLALLLASSFSSF